MKSTHDLAIFNTFKTKDETLTGEAQRQRSIIVVLAEQTSPAERTRTAISHRIADKSGTVWKNIYSGIFRDLDEVLLPLDLVFEEGHLPLKRGPKALQEQGIPYYGLTGKGLIVAAALGEVGDRRILLDRVLKEVGGDLVKVLQKTAEFVPGFTYSLIEEYVRSFCVRGTDLVPFSIESMKEAVGVDIKNQRELLKGFQAASKSDRAELLGLLDEIGKR